MRMSVNIPFTKIPTEERGKTFHLKDIPIIGNKFCILLILQMTNQRHNDIKNFTENSRSNHLVYLVTTKSQDLLRSFYIFTSAFLMHKQIKNHFIFIKYQYLKGMKGKYEIRTQFLKFGDVLGICRMTVLCYELKFITVILNAKHNVHTQISTM